MGRIPAKAAPTALATMAVSEMGVSSTRPGSPMASPNPMYWPMTPPVPIMSSAMANTVGSRSISSFMASQVACLYVLMLITPPPQS